MKSNSRSLSKDRVRKESHSRSPRSKSRSLQNSREKRSFSSSRSRNRSRNRSKDRSRSNENKGNVLYVTNLSSRIKEKHLQEKFEKYGIIDSVKIVKDPYTKESRGFAFVYYKTMKDADEAVESLNGYEIEGRRIRVEKAKRNKPRDQTPGRYLGHYKSRNVVRRSNSYSRDRKKYKRDRSKSRSRSYRRHSRSRSNSRSRSRRRRYSKYKSRS